MPKPADPAVRREGAGLAFAIGAYGLWGFLPGYFLLLAPASPFEVVAFRVIMSLIFCAILLTITRGWRGFIGLSRQPRVLGIMAVAGVLVFINWQVFVIAALSNQVVEGSLGYFINPIVTVLLGVVFLRERLRPAQWAAIGLAFIAVLVIVIGLGTFPWIALTLAFSFGLYGFIKKKVGAQVDAISGLTLETALLVPVAIVQLILVAVTVGLTFGQSGAGQAAAMVGLGVVTAVPLLLFAAAARRLSLVSIGLTQFLAPVLQLLFGVFVLNEAMPPGRWLGFALVWIALIVLTVDMIVGARASRRASVVPV